MLLIQDEHLEIVVSWLRNWLVLWLNRTELCAGVWRLVGVAKRSTDWNICGYVRAVSGERGNMRGLETLSTLNGADRGCLSHWYR